MFDTGRRTDRTHRRVRCSAKFVRNSRDLVLRDLNNALKWKGCGHLKLTYHHTFGDLDSLLLIDTDIILLNPVEELFAEMKKFSPTQVLAMATEHPWDKKAWDSNLYLS